MLHQGENCALPVPIRRAGLERNTPFSFSCMRCLQCCRNKFIQVNPYEVARLAKNLDISTTECISRYTTENGSFLKFDESNTCLFLGPDGCRVHADRPLVCRLYPIARQVNSMGDEWFSELEPEAGCAGRYGSKGSIREYLEEQGTLPFMRAADSYLKLLWQMMESVENSGNEEESLGSAENEVNDPDESDTWLDMDAAVRSYCRKTEISFPLDVEEKTRIHQNALQEWITQQ
jgi:uncharacterized protein